MLMAKRELYCVIGDFMWKSMLLCGKHVEKYY
jgi:hypothetical protein